MVRGKGREFHFIKKILEKGGVIAFPTETVYALGVDISNEKAIRKLYDLKGRDYSKPLSIFISSMNMLEEYVTEISPQAQKLIEKYWPGPLTLVFKASKKVPSLIMGGGKTIGIRMSSHPCVVEILEAFKKPITATSANISGQKSARTAEELKFYFRGAIDYVIEDNVGESQIESTVIDVSQDKFQVLREGALQCSI